MTQKARLHKMAINGAIEAVPFALGGPRGPIGVPHSSTCSNMAENLRYFNENGAIWVFWLHVKNVQKGMFLNDSARSPHRTAKPSQGCLLLAHPRAPPAVILSDRRSPSAMCEFPFEWWGCPGFAHSTAGKKTNFFSALQAEPGLFRLTRRVKITSVERIMPIDDAKERTKL